jgi:hypothetical protein
MDEDFETFFEAYLDSAFFITSDDDDPDMYLGDTYTVRDIDPESYSRLRADARKFYKNNLSDILTWTRQGSPFSAAGHDYWLTRNGHGAGFWDGDWDKTVGERLTKASERAGEISLYVGDDKKIYVYPPVPSASPASPATPARSKTEGERLVDFFFGKRSGLSDGLFGLPSWKRRR